MFASLPPHIKDFSIIQVTVTNGSPVSWTVKPADFSFERQDGTVLRSISADEVVASLLDKAGRSDVIKLQLLYEDSIYALSNFRSTNGYEQRREAAMAMFVNRNFKTGWGGFANHFSPNQPKAGRQHRGRVFFPAAPKEKSLGPGRVVARTCGQVFAFENYVPLRGR